jgi:hypothetical protein
MMLHNISPSIQQQAYRRLSKGIKNSQVRQARQFPGAGLQINKNRFSPIDIQIEMCHTSIIIRGQTIQPPSYRKEEVMSNMDSSNKPSAVASLLNK